MQKQILSFILPVLFSFPAINAQTGDRGIDIRLGLGMTNISNENAVLLVGEYELNVKWTDYFTVAPSIVLNHGGSSVFDETNFFQANLNAFGSPFRNDRQNDFRIGGGLSFYKLNRGGNHGVRSAFGFNLILEDSYQINDRFFIGLKTFLQPYRDKEIDWGVLLKIGANL